MGPATRSTTQSPPPSSGGLGVDPNADSLYDIDAAESSQALGVELDQRTV